MREADTAVQSADDHVHSVHRKLDFRWSTLVILLVAAAASIVLLTTLVTPQERDIGLLVGGWDFHVYRGGGRYVLNDLPLYTKPLDCCTPLLYTYTPFSALVFVPFVWLPDDADQHIWLAINVVLLIACVMLCFRILGYRITPYLAGISALLAIACGFLEPVRTTLFYGQINLLLMLMVLWDASRPEGSRLKGIGIGLAAGIKITPAYFVLYYLLLRQWRAAGVAVATLAATIGLGWLVLPRDSWQYWGGKFLDSSRISNWVFDPANQSLRGAIARLTKEMPATWLWVLADACLVAISMWIAVRLYRHGEPLLAVSVAGLSATAASPFTWTHHWVWLVPMTVYLMHRAVANAWWWVAVVPLFAVMGSWSVLLPNDHQQRIGLYLFQRTGVPWQVLLNLHLAVYAALLIIAGLIASGRVGRTRRGSAPP
ncbi:glycosyltransferase 87 family protein [Mycobacterium sp.]|uniref:glycosyltransferase 87 family protein n=1 Tax=Mycobacterium sp. TaxID=1785 RepID=UPI002C74BE87|nr:glycosyltransferase 87 family protein [Mycobacterium sp.]HTQ19382.1 glycosyltransferase 87 family protein [Mycobacterium sp.]